MDKEGQLHPIYIISIILSIAVLANIFIKIKDKKLIINELIFWLLILAALMLISIFPGFTVKTAHFFGFNSGFDFFVAISILTILLFLFNIYKKMRIIEEKLTRLNENIAIRQTLNNSKGNDFEKSGDENKTI